MSTWESKPKQTFLKAVGSSDDKMAADWMDSAPQEMSIIHLSKRPASISVDDYLVYRDHPAHLAVIAERIRPILGSRAAAQFHI